MLCCVCVVLRCCCCLLQVPFLENPLRIRDYRADPDYDVNPASENSMLWQTLRAEMPHLQPIPELQAEWQRIRAQAKQQLLADETKENIALWEKNKAKADFQRMQYGHMKTPIQVPALTPEQEAEAKRQLELRL